MVQQNTERTKQDTENMFKSVSDICMNAFESGMRFGQDAMKGFAGMFDVNGGRAPGIERIEHMAIDGVELIRKNAEQTQVFFDSACRNNMDMIRKTCEAGKVEETDAFARARDAWQSAIDAMRGNVDAAAKTTSKAIEHFSDFVGKNIQPGIKKPAK